MCYRVSELESKLGAGLIEEVIEVAKGELSLIDVIQKSQA
jgi:NADH dehydrogenase (ubiquinone) 1 alpha subcomplex subunit 5